MWKKSGLVILLLALTGCSNSVANSAEDTAGSIQNISSSAEVSESGIENNGSSTENGENSVEKPMNVFEEDGLKLELMSEADASGNILPESVKLKIENRMDYGCMIRSIGTAVNNVTISNSLKYAEIAGNESVEEDIMLSKLERELAGISDILSYEIFLRVGAGEEAKLVSLALSAPGREVPQYDGTVLYDDEFVNIKSQGILEKGLYFSPTVRLVIENKKDEILFINIDNNQAVANGEETVSDIGMGIWVFPHTACFVEPNIPLMASISDQLKTFETRLLIMDYDYQEITKVDIKISDEL